MTVAPVERMQKFGPDAWQLVDMLVPVDEIRSPPDGVFEKVELRFDCDAQFRLGKPARIGFGNERSQPGAGRTGSGKTAGEVEMEAAIGIFLFQPGGGSIQRGASTIALTAVTMPREAKPRTAASTSSSKP